MRASLARKSKLKLETRKQKLVGGRLAVPWRVAGPTRVGQALPLQVFRAECRRNVRFVFQFGFPSPLDPPDRGI
jgi:hypothetical protein